MGEEIPPLARMLLGEFTHTLDDKNRLTLPKKFLSELGKKLVISRWLDGSLSIYSYKAWQEEMHKMENLSKTEATARGFSRFFIGGATEVEPDKAGRVVVPEHLKSLAKLDKEAVLIGMQTRVEIWEKSRWEAYKTSLEQEGDQMAEKLGELGII